MIMYKFNDTVMDLRAVVAITWTGGTTTITVVFANTHLYLTPAVMPEDNPDASYADICELRYNELVTAWKKSRFFE